MIRLLAALLLILLASEAAACRPQPAAIEYGKEECTYCRMLITDSRYGAELVSRTGRLYKFDSIECLAAFYAEDRVPRQDVHSMWVTDFARPEHFIAAGEALYLRSPELRSPMGLNLTAFAKREDLEAARARYGGEEVRWDDILILVRQSGFMARHGQHRHVPQPVPERK